MVVVRLKEKKIRLYKTSCATLLYISFARSVTAIVLKSFQKLVYGVLEKQK